MKEIDIQGKRFGRWKVIKKFGSNQHGTLWLCKCDCGTNKIIPSRSLRTGVSKSCGCATRIFWLIGTLKHGMSGTSEYKAWNSMLRRCYLPDEPQYKNYGNRGIIVCEKWKNSFEEFLKDMGLKPSPEMQIDRIDNNGNYEPDNCRWATLEEQNNNRRDNHYLTYNGKTQTISQWARDIGIKRGTLSRRILIQKLNPEEALTIPVGGQ